MLKLHLDSDKFFSVTPFVNMIVFVRWSVSWPSKIVNVINSNVCSKSPQKSLFDMTAL